MKLLAAAILLLSIFISVVFAERKSNDIPSTTVPLSINSTTTTAEPPPSTKTTTTTRTTTTKSTTTNKVEVEVGGHDVPKSERQRIRSLLLRSYDKYAHPTKKHLEPVVVAIGMGLIHVDIKELTSTMEVDAWMRLNWKDESLQWDPENYGNLKKVHFGDQELWKPDILLYNNADNNVMNPYGNTHFLVDYTGDVLWVPPAHLKAFCKLDLKLWPMDKQECKLKFGSWTSHGDQIDLKLYKNTSYVERLNFYTNNREWKLESTSAEKRVTKYVCCPEKYPDITFTFTLQRSSPTYKAIIILPCLVVMLMSVCSFLLPPMSGEKTLLNGLALMVSVMYLIYFATILPFHSTTVPLIVMFYSNTTSLIGIAILLNVICINMATVRKHTSPPKIFRALFSGVLGRFLCLGHYYHQTSATHQPLVLQDMAESEQQQQRQEQEQPIISTFDEEFLSSQAIPSISPSSSAPTTIPTNGGATAATISSSSLDYGSCGGGGVMKEWILIAAGLERIALVVYTFIFAIVMTMYT